MFVFIKEHPELLESCISENSQIIEKEKAEKLMSTINEQSKCFLDEANSKISLQINIGAKTISLVLPEMQKYPGY